MSETSRVELTVGGVTATKAVVGPFELQLLGFPPRHHIGEFDVEWGYVVLVLDGALWKTFGRRQWALERESFATLPPGSLHTTTFGSEGSRVLALRSRGEDVEAFEQLLSRLRHTRAAALLPLGRRLAGELSAPDANWALAAEGLALQLVATASRSQANGNGRSKSWLRVVRDVLHEPGPTRSLSELAADVGVHPVHLGRSFRREYGVTVAEYARAIRLERAAERLTREDASLAEIALGAGFADQSHFTRAFRRYAGMTPGRYRRYWRLGPETTPGPRRNAPS